MEHELHVIVGRVQPESPEKASNNLYKYFKNTIKILIVLTVLLQLESPSLAVLPQLLFHLSLHVPTYSPTVITQQPPNCHTDRQVFATMYHC